MAEEETKNAEPENENVKEEGEKTQGAHCAHKHKALAIIIAALAVLFILGAGAFAALHLKNGRLVKRGLYGRGGYGMVGRNYRGGMMGGRGFRGRKWNGSGAVSSNSISGKVTAVNGQTFAVDASGTSKNVQIASATRFPLDSATSVKVGDTVVVRGQQDSSGTIQAKTILVNPQTTQM